VSRALLPAREIRGKQMILARLFRPKPNPAQPLYEAIVAAARQPWAYRDAGVADTIDGRFDFLVLHVCLVLERLGQQVPEFRQALIDQFCTDMDDNLRELGASDVGVGKKVRRMAEALAGRYGAYERAQDASALRTALQRNVYAGKPSDGLALLVSYAGAARALLAEQGIANLRAGKVRFA
jgi:cytochrome b pre-mRNA-processing protein 3